MIPRRSTERVAIEKRGGETAGEKQDFVAIEEPLEIRISFEENGARQTKSIAVTMRTPGDDFELAAGFLMSEGVIRSASDINQIAYCTGTEKQQYNVLSVSLRSHVAVNHAQLLRNFYTTSSCGVCGKASLESLHVVGAPQIPRGEPLVSEKVIGELATKLRGAQAVFDKTGGLHAAALFDSGGGLISIKEDVGRHNAVDKVVGEQFLQRKTPLGNSLLMVSGRTSFEIMQKALMAGIPIVAAVGAPSSLAVSLANEFGMTLIGFVREDRFNIYAGTERVG